MGGVSQMSPVEPGDTLAGRYRVERVIGIGGMGVVVAARHLDLDHLVAIKFLLPKFVENKDAVGRFTREARAAVRIQNEHVARVTDVGTLDNGAPYMVMEYLDGTDLEEFARSRGPLSIEDAVDFVLQASEAIAEAHGLGIIHRDLKPGNLFLVRRPDGSRVVKVLDFGISKVIGALGANAVAPTTTMLGSPPYMSPEQLSTPRDVDSRTDIWSLGVILYRLLTGRVPFDAETILELCVVILHGEPAPLREARADVPRDLEAIILRCMAKDRSRRYASVGELARALINFAPERSRVSMERISHLTSAQGPTADTVPSSPLRRSGSSEIPAAPMMETHSSWGQTGRGGKRSTRRSLLLVLTAALLVAGGVVIANQRIFLPSSGAEAPSSSPAVAAAAPPAAMPTPVAPGPELAKPVPSPAPSAAQSMSSAGGPESQTATPPPTASTLLRAPARPAPRPSAQPPRKIRNPTTGGWEEERK